MIDTKKLRRIIRLYISGLSLLETGKKVGLAPSTISYHLKKQNIKLRTSTETAQLPINETYFDQIDSEQKAYWLGFMMADGSVYNTSVCLKLAYKDIEHIKKFKQALKSKHKVGIGYDGPHKYAALRFKSKYMTKMLQKYNIVNNKSGKEILPNITQDLIKHYIRGYIDGDGWLLDRVADRKTFRLNFTLGFITGNLEFLQTIQIIFNEILDIPNGGTIRMYKSKAYPTYGLEYYGNNQVLLLSSWLYQDSTVYLDRKYKQYKKLQKQQQDL